MEDPRPPRWPPAPGAPPPGWGEPASWGPPPGPPPRRGRPWGRIVLAALLIGLLLASAGVGTTWFLASQHRQQRATEPSAPSATSPIRPAPQPSSAAQHGPPLDVGSITSRVNQGVVDIESVVQAAAPGSGEQRSGRAAGTGMLVTPGGQVLTNNHVIQGATSIRVTVAGQGRGYEAKVLGADPTDDVALLQVQGLSRAPTVQLADSSTLRVGEGVVAIGNALGQGGPPTATQGSISGLNRSVTAQSETGGAEELRGLIETDAQISPGDSGGPLVNSAAQVVGMITAGSSGGTRRHAASVGFAIPTSNAISVVNQIRSGKASEDVVIGEPGYLGVEARDLDAQDAARLGLQPSSGALVVGIVPGSPAQQAGIAPNSVITAIDGRAVRSTDELGQAIHPIKPGEELQVTWSDAQGSHKADVRLISGPAI